MEAQKNNLFSKVADKSEETKAPAAKYGDLFIRVQILNNEQKQILIPFKGKIVPLGEIINNFYSDNLPKATDSQKRFLNRNKSFIDSSEFANLKPGESKPFAWIKCAKKGKIFYFEAQFYRAYNQAKEVIVQ